jgi:hypothetical protein
VNLTTLLARGPPGVIDILNVDIQGAEQHGFDDHMAVLNARAKRVHIGTHGVDAPLVDLFAAHGWVVEALFPRTISMGRCTEPEDMVDTPFGPVCFGDGVLSVVNPRLEGK